MKISDALEKAHEDAKAPKHKYVYIERNRTATGPAGDPNFTSFMSEAKKRGEKVIGFTITGDEQKYCFKLMVKKDEHRAEPTRIFVPESFGGGARR